MNIFKADRTLVAIGCWMIGVFVIGMVGALIALRDGKKVDDEIDEKRGEEDDGLDQSWIDEMLDDLAKKAEGMDISEHDDAFDEAITEKIAEKQATDGSAENEADGEGTESSATPVAAPDVDPDDELVVILDDEPGSDDELVPVLDDEKSKTVYATPHGKVYHLDKECNNLRRAKQVDEMTEDEAIASGKKPCGVCGA